MAIMCIGFQMKQPTLPEEIKPMFMRKDILAGDHKWNNGIKKISTKEIHNSWFDRTNFMNKALDNKYASSDS
jgi:hypothetical protein